MIAVGYRQHMKSLRVAHPPNTHRPSTASKSTNEFKARYATIALPQISLAPLVLVHARYTGSVQIIFTCDSPSPPQNNHGMAVVKGGVSLTCSIRKGSISSCR